MRFLKKLVILAFIAVVVFFAALFSVKFALSSYLSQKISGQCSLGGLRLGLGSVTFKDLHLTSQELEAGLPEVAVGFELERGFKQRMLWIRLKEPTIKIKDLASLKNRFAQVSGKTSPHKSAGSQERLLTLLGIDNMDFSLEDKKIPHLDMRFSLRGVFSGIEAREIEEIEIARCNISSQAFGINELSLHRKNAQLHQLKISKVLLRGKEIKDIEALLSIEGERVVVISLQHYFLGEGAFLEGILDLNEYHNMCGSFDLKSAAFGHLAELFGGKESLSMRGEFAGSMDFCLKDFKISDINAGFVNDKGGFVNIQKEANLAFLKKYLDKKSYDSLVESLKNYDYNSADIGIQGSKGNISLKADFESEQGGKRNIVINFHSMK